MVLQLFLDLQLPPVISEFVSTEIIIIILFLSLHPPCQSQASFWSSGTESALDQY